MTIAPASEQDAKRRIGDILLELGFVTETQLAKASEEQDQTGQPLGQILVEHGAITRLELASALAEQWSAHAPITPLPVHPPANRIVAPPTPIDEDQYAARLQAAVADLAGKGTATATTASEPTLDVGPVRELAERLEATVARAQRLEATVATLAESMDGVTGGVEEAFNVLQSGMAGLALDLARIDTTVAELSQHAAEPPLPDEALTGRVAAVETRLDAAVDRAADAAAVESLAARLVAATDLDETLESALEALRLRVDDLARPEHGPGADAMRRVEVLEARLEQIPAAIEELRREAADHGADDLSPRLDDLSARIETLARDLDGLAHDLQAGVVVELVARMDVLETSLREGVAAPADLEALGERMAHEETAGEDLRAALATLSGRLDGGIVSPDELTAALAALEEDLRPAPPEPDPRIETLGEAVAELREQEAQQAQAIEEQLARLVTVEQLATAVEAATGRVEAGPDAQTVAELARLGEQIDLLAAPGDEAAVLASRLESLEATLVTPAELETALGELRDDLRALIPPPPTAPPEPEPDPRVAALEDDLEALRAEVAQAPAPATDPSLSARLDALEARIADAADARGAAAEAPTEEGLLRLIEPRLDELATQIAAIAELAARATVPVERPQTEPAAVAPATEGEIDERVETELERTRMAIERLSAHLGEHDRALREIMKDRAKTDESRPVAEERTPLDRGEAALDLRSIQRRLDGIEEDAHEDREKLMKRLERMATSIDWRLQRLEADGKP